ncbi:MAG: replication initiator protein A, partial [Singulisphaera sp.]|nr:replication initiator protein A [Singulisphaera sp.]
MNDEDKDPRRVGRDEMNLCEYPIASLTDHPPEGIKTLVFEDRHGRLTVIGSDAYGLPTALDNDVIVGLIQLT